MLRNYPLKLGVKDGGRKGTPNLKYFPWTRWLYWRAAVRYWKSWVWICNTVQPKYPKWVTNWTKAGVKVKAVELISPLPAKFKRWAKRIEPILGWRRGIPGSRGRGWIGLRGWIRRVRGCCQGSILVSGIMWLGWGMVLRGSRRPNHPMERKRNGSIKERRGRESHINLKKI